MANLVKKSFDKPDDLVAPDKTRAEILEFGTIKAVRVTAQPGWTWSECIKPHVGGESCQAGHIGVVISGRMKCIHEDGSELEVKPGDAYYFAPGHDGWVIGDEQCVVYEIVEGGKDFGPWKHAH